MHVGVCMHVVHMHARIAYLVMGHHISSLLAAIDNRTYIQVFSDYLKVSDL